MHIKRALVMVLVCTLSVTVVAIGPASRAQTECTWEIGLMGAFSGDYASYGAPIGNAIELAIQEINDGGTLACTLEMNIQDSQGDPNQAPSLARKLGERESVVACLCGFFSGETLATGAIFERYGLLMVSTGTNNSNDDQGFGTWFRANASEHDQGRATGRYIRQRLSARRVVLVRDHQSYSKQMARVISRRLGSLVKRTYVLREGESDHSPAVVQTKDARPDVVVYTGFGRDAGIFLKQLRDAGVRATYVTTVGMEDHSFQKTAGRRARGASTTCGCSFPEEIDTARPFAAAYEGTYGEPPRFFAGDMYDIMHIVGRALKSETSASTFENIRSNLIAHFDEAVRAEGVIKRYTWEQDGELHSTGRHVFVFRRMDDHWSMKGSVFDLVN